MEQLEYLSSNDSYSVSWNNSDSEDEDDFKPSSSHRIIEERKEQFFQVEHTDLNSERVVRSTAEFNHLQEEVLAHDAEEQDFEEVKIAISSRSYKPLARIEDASNSDSSD